MRKVEADAAKINDEPTALYGGRKSEVSDRLHRSVDHLIHAPVSLFPHAFALLHLMSILYSCSFSLVLSLQRILSSLIFGPLHASSPAPREPMRYRDESAYVTAGTFLRTTLRSWRVRDAFALHRVPKRPHSDALVPGISIRPPHARSSW